MPATDLDLLITAARRAGPIAMKHWRSDPQIWEKPDAAGPVTEADLAVNASLEADLTGARPDYGWLSEETTDTAARLSSDTIFVVDPIDGTRAFIAGEPTWSIALAVVTHGQPTAAVVFLPATGDLFAATSAAATLNDAPIRPTAATGAQGATILAARPNMDAAHWQNAAPPPIKRHFRPSLAYRLALVAEGRFDAMLTLRDAWEWDIAAGALIAQSAGARVTDRNGQPLVFNNPHPKVPGVLTAGPDLHSILLGQLA